MSYRELKVWQKAMDVVEGIYTFTDGLPKNEQFGLVSQMRRSAVSIPSNIAEGYRRGSSADYRRFLLIAFGSGAELETQMEIVYRVYSKPREESEKITTLLSEVMRMLNALQKSLSDQSNN